MKIDRDLVKQIDLRGTSCPVNFVKCKLALEELLPNQLLQVELDTGEPELMVVAGLKEAGHKVEIVERKHNWIRLLVFYSGS